MNWRDAFLTQAWSDYQLFEKLNSERCPLCHKLHYLQMATEKLAKSFLCSPKSDNPPRKTHYAFVRFLKLSKQRHHWRKGLGYEHNLNAYASYIDSLIPVAERIEKLAPVGGNFDKVNPEYPWIDGERIVICPALHHFSEFKKTDLVKIRDLVFRLFRIIKLPERSKKSFSG